MRLLPLVIALGMTAPLCATEFQVKVEPSELSPGEAMKITVQGSGSRTIPVGSFLGEPLVFMPRRNHSGWIAFAGIDLDTSPGSHALLVRLGDSEDDLSHALDIEVQPKTYPIENLKVAPKYVNPPPEVTARINREAEDLAGIWARPTSEILYDGDVVRPLPEAEGRNFGRRRVFNNEPRSPHSGTDLSAPEGTPVEASASGQVVMARDLYYSGNLVVLDHGGGVYTLYAHLSRLDVKEGDRIAAGHVIGLVGATGRVTGPHLHWGARIREARVNPANLLNLLTD